MVGTKNGLDVTFMFLDYDFSETIDFHAETATINTILKQNDVENLWGKIKSFKVKESEAWSECNMSCFFLKKINLE